MKRILFLGLLFAAGCKPYVPSYSAFGRDGKTFTAPDMCGALTQCLKSGETECYEATESTMNAAGQTEVVACKKYGKQ